MDWSDFFVYYMQAALALLLLGTFLAWMWSVRTGEYKDRAENEWRIRNLGAGSASSGS